MGLSQVGSHSLDPFSGVVASLLLDFLLIGGQSLLFLDQLFSLLSVSLVGLSGGFSDELGVGVEFVHGLVVVEGVGLLAEPGGGSLDWSKGGLDFVGVNDPAQVGVGDDTPGEVVSLLLVSGSLEGSEDVVEFLEGSFSPDDESPDVSSWGELEEVHSRNVDGFDSGHVPQSSDQRDVGSAVDNQRSFPGSVPSVSYLSSSGSDGDGVDHLLHIGVGSHRSQESHGFLGSFDLLGAVVNNQREFGDSINSVSSGLDQGEDGAGSDRGGGGVSLLFEIGSPVPSPPDSEGGEHSSLSTLVTKGSLA